MTRYDLAVRRSLLGGDVNYESAGERRAFALGSRGPLHLDNRGRLDAMILDQYREHGFYVFEGLLASDEVAELQADLELMLDRAPHAEGATTDAQGRPALGAELPSSPFGFARPLSDSTGGDERSPVRMAELEPPPNAPEQVLVKVGGALQFMDSFLRLYGHPRLLEVAAAINGADFAPFAESIVIKQPRLGAAIAWHQDDKQLWEAPEWDADTHGFNFMAQLYSANAANGLWWIPGSHSQGRLDIAAIVEANDGSPRLPNAVPLVSQPGDVAIVIARYFTAPFQTRLRIVAPRSSSASIVAHRCFASTIARASTDGRALSRWRSTPGANASRPSSPTATSRFAHRRLSIDGVLGVGAACWRRITGGT